MLCQNLLDGRALTRNITLIPSGDASDLQLAPAIAFRCRDNEAFSPMNHSCRCMNNLLTFSLVIDFCTLRTQQKLTCAITIISLQVESE